MRKLIPTITEIIPATVKTLFIFSLEFRKFLLIYKINAPNEINISITPRVKDRIIEKVFRIF